MIDRSGTGRRSQGKAHIELTLSLEVVTLLRELPIGERSKFVDDWLRQHPRLKARLKKRPE